jgi:hypothetical protein
MNNMPQISSAWAKVLLIYENGDLKAVGVFNGSKEFYEISKMSADEVGEMLGANPQNLKYDKGSEQ